MTLTKYIACICEGTAEETIMSLLLDADKLIFSKNALLEGELLRCRSAKNFERYLNKQFSEKITVLRVLDSRTEKFNISKSYACKIEVNNIITAPEIEMLIVFGENRYVDYKKSGKKPSDFCIQDLGFRNVKSEHFVKNYFSDINKLINAICMYKSKSCIPKGEYCLKDLLK